MSHPHFSLLLSGFRKLGLVRENNSDTDFMPPDIRQIDNQNTHLCYAIIPIDR